MIVKWKYKGKLLREVPEDAIGFVYLITFRGAKEFYVGQKSFFSRRRVKVKDRKNRKVVVKESDWKSYCTSSKEVKERLRNGEEYTAKVLYICNSKSALNYMEAYEMFRRWVLTDPLALNKNILMKLFHDPKGNYQ